MFGPIIVTSAGSNTSLVLELQSQIAELESTQAEQANEIDALQSESGEPSGAIDGGTF